ncbi:MAG: hypothetical protein Tsb0034_22630 [Ekhidna sp.]
MKQAFRILIGVITIVLLSLTISCSNDDFSLNDPIEDGVLREEFPRIGLPPEKQEEFETKLGTEQWQDLIGRMNAIADGAPDQYGFGAYHFAVAFAITGEQKYANKSKEIIFRVINEPGYCDLTSTYLRAPGCTGQVSFAADIIFDELSDKEKKAIFDYLEAAASGIVNLEGWNGWGWMDGNPVNKEINNFYPGHIQTILNYALLAYNHRELAREYFNMIVNEELPQAFEMIEAEIAGGHGAEGTWYDDKMFGHYAEVVLMLREATDGRVDFGREYADVFADYATWRLYSIMNMRDVNGQPHLYDTPTGDQPAIDEAKVIDLTRLRLWLFSDILKDTDRSDAAGYIRYFEDNVDFEFKGQQREYQLNYLLHYDPSIPSIDFTQALPSHWYSSGKGVAQFRTGWDENAMAATVHFSPSQGQRNSHWHFGEGAFYIWYKGWQADHINRVEGNGIQQYTGLMNTLLVNGNDETQGAGDASVTVFSGGDNYMVVKGEATELYDDYLSNFERTFIVSDQVISVYDHVEKLDASDEINFLVHNESGFSINGNRYTASNHEGQIVVETRFPTGFSDVAMTSQGQSRNLGVQVNINSSSAALDMLHTIQVGDKEAVIPSTFDIDGISTDTGRFFGALFIPSDQSYAHIVNTQDKAASEISYSLSSENIVEHVIVGVSSGTYTISLNDEIIATATSDDDGILVFSSLSGGDFFIEK